MNKRKECREKSREETVKRKNGCCDLLTGGFVRNWNDCCAMLMEDDCCATWMGDNCYTRSREVTARKDVEEILYSEGVVPNPINQAVAEEVFSSIDFLHLRRQSDSPLDSAIHET
jgi:hypothetical protein